MKKIAFVWDNFGPLHDDRLRACVNHFGHEYSVFGIEINGKSNVYSWKNEHLDNLPKLTLFPDRALSEISNMAMFVAVLKSLLRLRIQIIFLCHYERTGTALLAYTLRLFGRRVYVMGCPKFDDRPRSASKEFAKQFFLAPYMGALVGGPGTRDYLAFLSLRGKPMYLGYNTVSNARIRKLAQADGSPPVPFEQRDFVIVARLVPKKNIATAIRGYAQFVKEYPSSSRKLHLCGDGPLETELRELVTQLQLHDSVIFHGFVQSEQVARILNKALALILISTEEQFGNVVPEALALGIPLILSDVCGARYELLRTGVNGFLVESQNIDGLAYYLGLLHQHHHVWDHLSKAANDFAHLGDVERFAEGVEALIS